MIRAVIFDLGHTLWDILPDTEGLLDAAYDDLRRRLCAALGHEDLPASQALRRAVGEELRATAERHDTERRLDEPPPHTYLAAACRKLGLEFDAELLCELSPPLFATELHRLNCADGTLETVRELHHAGYVLGCITNTLTTAATIRAMLREHGFEPFMRSVVVSSEEGWRKPHLSLFEKSLEELAVASGEAVFVGDSPWHDVEGARSAGMRAVLTRQYATRPTGGFAPPDATIDHIRELRSAIATFDASVSAAATRTRD
jgi:putative hydrolase of the HAD superfamily